MGLLTEKYNAWAKHPEKYTAKQVLDQIVADLKWLDEEELKNCNIQRVSNLLCGSFEPDNKTSSATKCKCGREKWEHPKAT